MQSDNLGQHERTSKAIGCLVGLAIGDAVGMPVEFLSREQIADLYGCVSGLVASPDWHPHVALTPGSITDDTGQALALAGIYLEQGQMSAEAAGEALLNWADANQATLSLVMGPSTQRALEALRQGVDPHESGRGGKTNGAAMRVAPVGIVHGGDLDAIVRDTVQACLPTHGTMLAISGATAVAAAIGAAMMPGCTLDDLLAATRQGAMRGREHGAWAWTAPLERRIDLAVELVQNADSEAAALTALYELVGVDMLVTETIPTAIGLVVLAAGDPMKAILYAANLGGDADTIGAIAGAICGAWRGADALDRQLWQQVERINGLDLAQVAGALVDIRGKDDHEWPAS